MTTAGAASSAPALELRGIDKSFGAVQALDGATVVVEAGTVHAVLGENGAGKTTLMRIAYGLESATRGSVSLFGRELRPPTVRAAMRAGVGMVHQHLSLAPDLSAAENFALGGRAGGVFRPREAAALLERTGRAAGFEIDATRLVRDLGIVEQQRLEIVKALARDARLLILDEPTAVLAPGEVDDLLGWLRSFASAGGTVVLVTHKLREALAIANRVTVLRRGRVAWDGPVADTSAADLAHRMFGAAKQGPGGAALERAPDSAPAAVVDSGHLVVEAERIDVTDARGVTRLRGASLRVRRGDIVGVAAVEGSGHRELLAAIAGLQPPTAGSLRLPDRTAFIPADRRRDALIPELTVVDNVALRGLARRRGLMPWRSLRERAQVLLGEFGVRAPSVDTRVAALSGGNQQRLVVARELDGGVDLVVADNPTQGLDVRAAAFVLDELRRAAAGGAGVVMHSGDLDEALAVATRMVVVFDGALHELPLERDVIARAMVGVRAAVPA